MTMKNDLLIKIDSLRNAVENEDIDILIYLINNMGFDNRKSSMMMDFAKQIIVMNRGEIMGEGPARQVLGNDSLLNKARLLPPQIAQVAKLLGPGFDGIFTDDEMIAKIKEAL